MQRQARADGAAAAPMERQVASRPAPYFHGNISAADAAALLSSAAAGSFLIGFGAADRLSFTLHYRGAADAAPQHADIRASGGSFTVDAAGQSWTGESLTQLVVRILSSPDSPLPCVVPSKRFQRAQDAEAASSPQQSPRRDAGVPLYIVGSSSSDGALGIGAVVAACTPTPVPRPRLAAAGRFMRLAIGSTHVIGLTHEGAAWGWGSNATCQLGSGPAALRVDTPREISALLGHKIVAAAAGDKHSLFLSASGDVFATGYNSTGACGVGLSPAVVKTPVALAFFTRRPFRRHDPALALLQPALPSLSLMLERWEEPLGDDGEEGDDGDAASMAAGVTASPTASPAGVHGRAASTTQVPPPLPPLSAASQSPAVKRQLGPALRLASQSSDDASGEVGCVTSPDGKDVRSTANSHRRLGSISHSRRSLTSRSARSYSSTVLNGGSMADSRTNSLSASGFLAARLTHGMVGGASSHALVADASYRTSTPSGASDEDMMAIASRGTAVGLRKTLGTAAASGSSPAAPRSSPGSTTAGTPSGRPPSAAAGAAVSPPAGAAGSSSDVNDETWSDVFEGEPVAEALPTDGTAVSPASPAAGAHGVDAAAIAAKDVTGITTPAKRVLLSSTSAAKSAGAAASTASKPAPLSVRAVSPATGGASADAEPPDVIVDVQAGGDTSFAVSLLGRVYAWGANAVGQTGTGVKGNVPRPMPVHELRQQHITQVSAGPEHAVFVTLTGQVYATGSNTYGRLGLGDDVDRSVPTRVRGAVDSAEIIKASCGATHTLLLTANTAEVYSFGDNSKYALGLGSTVDEAAAGASGVGALSPTTVAPSSVAAAEGSSGLPPLLAPGFLPSKGAAIAAPNLRRSNVPVLVARLAPHEIVDIAAGKHHSAACSADGIAFVWGQQNKDHVLGVLDGRGVAAMVEADTQMRAEEVAAAAAGAAMAVVGATAAGDVDGPTLECHPLTAPILKAVSQAVTDASSGHAPTPVAVTIAQYAARAGETATGQRVVAVQASSFATVFAAVADSAPEGEDDQPEGGAGLAVLQAPAVGGSVAAVAGLLAPQVVLATDATAGVFAFPSRHYAVTAAATAVPAQLADAPTGGSVASDAAVASPVAASVATPAANAAATADAGALAHTGTVEDVAVAADAVETTAAAVEADAVAAVQTGHGGEVVVGASAATSPAPEDDVAVAVDAIAVSLPADIAAVAAVLAAAVAETTVEPVAAGSVSADAGTAPNVALVAGALAELEPVTEPAVAVAGATPQTAGSSAEVCAPAAASSAVGVMTAVGAAASLGAAAGAPVVTTASAASSVSAASPLTAAAPGTATPAVAAAPTATTPTVAPAAVAAASSAPAATPAPAPPAAVQDWAGAGGTGSGGKVVEVVAPGGAVGGGGPWWARLWRQVCCC